MSRLLKLRFLSCIFVAGLVGLVFMSTTETAKAAPLALAYCIFQNQYPSPYVKNGTTFTSDPHCEPSVPVASLTLKSAASGANVQTTATTISGATLNNWTCWSSFLGMCLQWAYSLQALDNGASNVNKGSLPYVNPGDQIDVSWQCQPSQTVLYTRQVCTLVSCLFDTHSPQVMGINFTNYGVSSNSFTTHNKTSGSTVITAPQNTKQITLSCSGSGSNNGTLTYTASFELKVDNPKGSISAAPAQVKAGAATMLSWSAKNVKDNSCTVTSPSGKVIGSPNTNSGSNVSSGPIPAKLGSSVVFTLTCKRYNGASISWQSNAVAVKGGVLTCAAGTHNAGGVCVPNTQACSITNGSGTQTWNGSSWGACMVTSCNANFHISGNSCVPNTQACSVTNGSGTQTWNGSSWGACMVTSCNPGFNLVGNACQAISIITSNPSSITSFTVTPSRLRSGTYIASFAWVGSNLPASCNISSTPKVTGLPSVFDSTNSSINPNGIGGSFAPSGGIGPITQVTQFTLTCGSGPLSSATATVTLDPLFQEI